MAMTMPMMPSWLPRRDVVGCERPRSARINRTAATRYANEVRDWFIGGASLLLEHGKHAVGHREAAKDVDADQHHGEEAEEMGDEAAM